jgi:hypothetical protein
LNIDSQIPRLFDEPPASRSSGRNTTGTMDFQHTKGTFELAGKHFPRVTWYKQKGMRGLYVCLLFVVLTSATNGYDSSMMNGLQSLEQWRDCE